MDLHHLLPAGLPAHSGLPRSTDIIRPARLVRFVPETEVTLTIAKTFANVLRTGALKGLRPNAPVVAAPLCARHSAATGRSASKIASPASNGVSGCIRNAQKHPSSSSPIDIKNGRYQLPVT